MAHKNTIAPSAIADVHRRLDISPNCQLEGQQINLEKKKRGIKKVKNMEINLLGLVACFRLQYTCIFNKILKEQNVKLNKQEQNTK